MRHSWSRRLASARPPPCKRGAARHARHGKGCAHRWGSVVPMKAARACFRASAAKGGATQVGSAARTGTADGHFTTCGREELGRVDGGFLVIVCQHGVRIAMRAGRNAMALGRVPTEHRRQCRSTDTAREGGLGREDTRTMEDRRDATLDTPLHTVRMMLGMRQRSFLAPLGLELGRAPVVIARGGARICSDHKRHSAPRVVRFGVGPVRANL